MHSHLIVIVGPLSPYSVVFAIIAVDGRGPAVVGHLYLTMPDRWDIPVQINRVIILVFLPLLVRRLRVTEVTRVAGVGGFGDGHGNVGVKVQIGIPTDHGQPYSVSRVAKAHVKQGRTDYHCRSRRNI